MEQGVSKSWKDLEQHDRKSLNRLVEMWTLRKLPVKVLKEVRKLLLETEGRGSLLWSGKKLGKIIICSNTKSICP